MILFFTIRNRNSLRWKRVFDWLKRDKGAIQIVKGDIRKQETISKLYHMVQDFGGVDILINNAGVYHKGSFQDTHIEEYKEVIDINLIAPIVLTKTLWTELIVSKGIVVNINSMAGKKGSKDEFLYCASKHGLKGFSEALQYEATKEGVRVIDLCLGAMKTDMTKKHRADWDDLIDPEEAANLVYSICKKHKTLRVTEIDVSRRIY